VGIGAVAGVDGCTIRADVFRAYKDHTHGFEFFDRRPRLS
jgi:hypothetical protein